MKIDELKQLIGNRIKDIIEADRADGIGSLTCFLQDHKSNPEMHWEANNLKFCCHNCRADDEASSYYDAWDHALWQADGDKEKAVVILHEMAGVEMDEPSPVVQKKPEPVEWEGITPLSRKRSPEMVQYMLSRGISEATLKRYHVTGDDRAMYFNYVCDETLVKIKGRLIGSHANGRDKYSPTPKGGTNTLYGQHTRQKQQVLAICEGEIDALSIFEALSSRGMDAQISVSSVPSGSSSFGWLENSLPYILEHSVVIIVPDNDKPGKKFANKLQSELISHVRVSTVDFKPWKVNDANELLQEHGKDELGRAILNAKEYRPDYTVDLEAIKDLEHTCTCTGFFTLDKILYGLQHGMMTLFTGKSGDGKTTILRQIIASCIKRNERVGALMGEESPAIFRQLYIQQAHHGEEGYLDEWHDAWGNKRYKTAPKGVQYFSESIAPYLSMFDNMRLTDPDTVQKMYEWIKREASLFGTRLFIIDNLMKLESGSDGQLLETQRQISNTLKTFCEVYNIHIILVAHPRKDTDVVTVDSISGSKNITNVVDNVIIFQRLDNINSEMRENLTKRATGDENYGEVTAYLKIGKNRFSGVHGYVPMRYDQESNTIYDINLYSERGHWTTGPTNPTRTETW